MFRLFRKMTLARAAAFIGTFVSVAASIMMIASSSTAQRNRQPSYSPPPPPRYVAPPLQRSAPPVFNRPSAPQQGYRPAAPLARPVLTPQERTARVVNRNAIRDRVRQQAMQVATVQRARIQAVQAMAAARAASVPRSAAQAPAVSGSGRPVVAPYSNISTRLTSVVAKLRGPRAASAGGGVPPSGSGGSGGTPPQSPPSLRTSFGVAAAKQLSQYSTVQRPQPSTRFVASQMVVDKYSGRRFYGLIDLEPTLARISRGENYAHRNDGSIYQNRQARLPPKEHAGYYKEYVHPTPGIQGPGPQRIVIGAMGELWYTPNHYKSFIRIK